MNHRRATRGHVQTPPQKTSPVSAALTLIGKVWGVYAAGVAQLVFGEPLANPVQPGIKFTRTITIPQEFTGSTFWVQVVHEAPAILRDALLTDHVATYNGNSPYLDGEQGVSAFPYSTNPETSDSPALNQPSPWFIRGEASGNFTMWLLFQPYDGMWVPLRAVDWYWHGSATNGPPTGDWLLESNRGDHSVDPQDYDTQTYPLWKSLVTDYYWNPPLE